MKRKTGNMQKLKTVGGASTPDQTAIVKTLTDLITTQKQLIEGLEAEVKRLAVSTAQLQRAADSRGAMLEQLNHEGRLLITINSTDVEPGMVLQQRGYTEQELKDREAISHRAGAEMAAKFYSEYIIPALEANMKAQNIISGILDIGVMLSRNPGAIESAKDQLKGRDKLLLNLTYDFITAYRASELGTEEDIAPFQEGANGLIEGIDMLLRGKDKGESLFKACSTTGGIAHKRLLALSEEMKANGDFGGAPQGQRAYSKRLTDLIKEYRFNESGRLRKNPEITYLIIERLKHDLSVNGSLPPDDSDLLHELTTSKNKVGMIAERHRELKKS